jgi:hypothetical protein
MWLDIIVFVDVEKVANPWVCPPRATLCLHIVHSCFGRHTENVQIAGQFFTLCDTLRRDIQEVFQGFLQAFLARFRPLRFHRLSNVVSKMCL